jgi:hypothetical protein
MIADDDTRRTIRARLCGTALAVFRTRGERMTANALRRIVAAMAALVLVPIATRADPLEMHRVVVPVGHPTPWDSLTDMTPRNVREAHAPGPLTAVNERITRDLGNGCYYEATLRGQYRTRKRTRGMGFDPAFELRAGVRCQNGRSVSAPAARIRGTDLTERQLTSALAERGRVLAPSERGACAYTPSFSVNETQVVAHAVWQMCSVATGGGPSPQR